MSKRGNVRRSHPRDRTGVERSTRDPTLPTRPAQSSRVSRDLAGTLNALSAQKRANKTPPVVPISQSTARERIRETSSSRKAGATTRMPIKDPPAPGPAPPLIYKIRVSHMRRSLSRPCTLLRDRAATARETAERETSTLTRSTSVAYLQRNTIHNAPNQLPRCHKGATVPQRPIPSPEPEGA